MLGQCDILFIRRRGSRVMTNSKIARLMRWPGRARCRSLKLVLASRSSLQYQRRDRVRSRSDGKMARLAADGSDLRVIETPVHSSYSLAGVVRFLSSVSTTKTASSFAGSVLLALRLIGWLEPGISKKLSPAR